jgi:hypothetical protein
MELIKIILYVMSLSNLEKEHKIEMLLSDPNYKLPSDVSEFDKANIVSRIDQRENNRYINPPPFGYGHARDRTKILPTIGGKSKSKNNRKWSKKYKKSINCKRPKGFSQKQYCKYGKK